MGTIKGEDQLQASWMRKGRGRMSVGRSLGLFCAVLLLSLAGSCRDKGPAETAGREIDETVEMAREMSEGALEDLGRGVDEVAKETKKVAKETEEMAKEIE
jgi:hypothetical protein